MPREQMSRHTEEGRESLKEAERNRRRRNLGRGWPLGGAVVVVLCAVVGAVLGEWLFVLACVPVAVLMWLYGRAK